MNHMMVLQHIATRIHAGPCQIRKEYIACVKVSPIVECNGVVSLGGVSS